MNFKPLSGIEESIAKKIVDACLCVKNARRQAAFTVHKKLGPGLLEKIYEICFCHELSKRGLKYQRQIDIPIVYDGIVFDEGLRLDVLVEDLVICEIKAVDEIHPVKYLGHIVQQNLLLVLFHGVNSVWVAQILSHLKLTNKRLGFLINFNVSLIKDGIKRFIL